MKLTDQEREFVELAIDQIACGAHPLFGMAITKAVRRLRPELSWNSCRRLGRRIADLEFEINGPLVNATADGRVARLRRLLEVAA